MSKLISICLATYNGEKYLQEQMDSLVAQTYENFELIVQDDFSSDNTVNVVESYSDRLDIKLAINKSNLGYIENFEIALKKTSGEYIAICDQDDIWDKNKLQILIDNLQDNSLIYSNSLLIDENGNSLGKTLSQKLKNNFIDSNSSLNFLYDNCVSAHSMLFSKELLNHIFPLPKNIYFDQWIAATAANLDGVKYIDKILVNYRQHDSNTLGNRNKNSDNIMKKMLSKIDKKISANSHMLKITSEFKNLKVLSSDDNFLLDRLINFHKNFKNSYYDFTLYQMLYKNRDTLFKITKKNRVKLSLKKSIGLKLYKAVPVL